MNRWSTPKSYRKFKESYVNLDDDPYNPNATIFKAPRKDRRKKPLYSSFSEGSYEYKFPGSPDNETRDLHFKQVVNQVEQREDVENDERSASDTEWNPSFTSVTTTTDLYSPPRLSRQITTSRGDLLRFLDDKDTITRESRYPIQKRHHFSDYHHILRPKIPLTFQYHEIIGPASLNIHRLRLPSQYLHLLDKIVAGCEDHVSTLSCGWHTDLYSLTKQDVALREAPEVYDLARPVLSYVKKIASTVYGVQGLKCDRNQPHVLKYDDDHQGVELHHDKCDITVNLMMSRSNTYSGGGTYFPDANTNVRLEFGEFLLHPGSSVHGGSPISSGTRYLMVIFANAK